MRTQGIYRNETAVLARAPLQTYSGLTGDAFTWYANITAGLSLVSFLNDSVGSGSISTFFVVQFGSDQSCLSAADRPTNQTRTTTTARTTTISITSSDSLQPPLGPASSRPASDQPSSTTEPIPPENGAVAGPGRPVGPIIGASVAGALGGVMLVLVGALFLRRCMVRQRPYQVEHLLQDGTPGLPNKTARPFVPALEKVPGTEASLPPLPIGNPSGLPPTSVPPCNEPHTNDISATQLDQEGPSAPRRIRREVDAGSVHMGGESELGGAESTLTLPPAYEDVPLRERQRRK
ncbi:hypothetical protein GY45DRAFT_36625 [Cubamyces sp. BRFM 1775]|nr:hypothetical protein GY45DRAFT_36625 [Cubamyces sp. BRFM 1775]